MKPIIVIILTAFTLGLLGETAFLIHALATTQAATLPWDTVIKVGISWLVVLSVFYHRILTLPRHNL